MDTGALAPSDARRAHIRACVELARTAQRPLSRGRVHLQSSDPLAAPAIDPAYLAHPIDLRVLVRAAQFARAAAHTAPLADTVVRMVEPGPEVQSDAEWEAYVRRKLSPVWHPVGTAAMLPREDGGVVDPRLVVYGTRNLRIVSRFGPRDSADERIG